MLAFPIPSCHLFIQLGVCLLLLLSPSRFDVTNWVGTESGLNCVTAKRKGRRKAEEKTRKETLCVIAKRKERREAICVTNRGTNVTGYKRYHSIYVVHQTESVVLSDDSELRYAMSQRQADTQNTKSNSPPVWKTVGISRGVKDICNTSTPQCL